MTFDVVVIGAGIAGTAAALAANARGARTAIVRRGPGVTALAAGGWRGPLPDALAAALAGAGLTYRAGPFRLCHPAGDLRSFDHAPASHAAAVAEAGALVCGIAGLPGWRAEALAAAWSEAAGVPLPVATLHLPHTPAAGWSPVSLAAELDREPAPLAEAVARASRETGAARVILPAVLGLEPGDAVRAAIGDAAGLPVGEALGVPPSVPGWRLDRALLAALRAAGIEVLDGRVVARETASRRLAAIELRPGRSQPVRVVAASFVLASGKFAGGGIEANGAGLREVALGCPVWLEHLGERFDAVDPLSLTHADRLEPQPLLGAGVRSDGGGRPVGRGGDVVYDNVRIAGSVRSGHDTASLGLGEAAIDGWQAGERAAEAVR